MIDNILDIFHFLLIIFLYLLKLYYILIALIFNIFKLFLMKNSYLNNPSYIFENILNKKKNKLLNLKSKQNKIDEQIGQSLRILVNYSDKFKIQLHPNLDENNVKNKKLIKSNSEIKIKQDNTPKTKTNSKNIFLSLFQIIEKRKEAFKKYYIDHLLSNEELNKSKLLYSPKNDNSKILEKIKGRNSIQNIIKNKSLQNLSNKYSKKSLKEIFKNPSSNNLISPEKKKTIKFKRNINNKIKQLNYNSQFKRTPPFNININYIKKNYAKSTISSKLNEKGNILKESNSLKLIYKEERGIMKKTKTIKNIINKKIFSEKKFYKKRKYLHSAKYRNIINSLNETKFIENINKNKDDDINDVKHHIQFTKLKKDLNLVSELNNSVVYSQRNFLMKRYGEYKGKKKQ